MSQFLMLSYSIGSLIYHHRKVDDLTYVSFDLASGNRAGRTVMAANCMLSERMSI